MKAKKRYLEYAIRKPKYKGILMTFLVAKRVITSSARISMDTVHFSDGCSKNESGENWSVINGSIIEGGEGGDKSGS